MKEDLILKAHGMTFSIGLSDEIRPTPRVIHALGKNNAAYFSRKR